MRQSSVRIALVLAAVLSVAASCPPRPPNPTPTPTPTPVPTPIPPIPSGPDALLRITPQLVLTNLTGQPVKLRGCVAYYVPNHPEINSLWPGASKGMMDWFAQYGCRAYEHRLGPFIAKCANVEDDNCGESLWFDAGIGGSYNPDGSINEKFGDAVEAAVAYGDSKGWYQGIILIDTWGCKVSQNGNPYNPWITLAPQSLTNCGNSWDSVQDIWVRYWVKRLTKYAHVYWQLDNEGDLVRKPRQEWWDAQLQTIRDEEKKNGANVHLTLCTAPFSSGCDFVYTHALPPVQELAGKFTLLNEYNPPHYSPGEIVSAIADADAAPHSIAMSYWQGDSTDAQSIATLEGMKAAFDGHQPGCYAPDGNDERWQGLPDLPPLSQSVSQAYNAAKAAVGDRCGATGQCTPAREPCAPPVFLGCIDTSELVAADLRKQGLCASGAWGGGPEIAVLDGDGIWKQLHPCATETGCYVNSPYKAAWKFNGPNPTPGPTPTPTPPPGQTCTNPPAIPVDHFNAKVHTVGPNKTVVDSTPIIHNAAYCASIGMQALDCPVRQEGDPLRTTCEADAVGAPQWVKLPPNGFQSPENAYQAWIPRGNPGVARVCSSKHPTACGETLVPE